MREVEALVAADVPAAAGVLARAFRDNPAMLSLLPGETEERRLHILLPCMMGFVRSVVRYGRGQVVRADGAVVAVSLSFRPREFPPPFLATVIQARGPLRAGLGATLRFARMDHEMRKRHPHYTHFYLWFLGVLPERQGQGFGSVLLRALSEEADASSMPSYLETDKPSSVKLYERHGYRVEAEDVLPGLAVRLWYMRRPESVAANRGDSGTPGMPARAP